MKPHKIQTEQARMWIHTVLSALCYLHIHVCKDLLTINAKYIISSMYREKTQNKQKKSSIFFYPLGC